MDVEIMRTRVTTMVVEINVTNNYVCLSLFLKLPLDNLQFT